MIVLMVQSLHIYGLAYSLIPRVIFSTNCIYGFSAYVYKQEHIYSCAPDINYIG